MSKPHTAILLSATLIAATLPAALLAQTAPPTTTPSSGSQATASAAASSPSKTNTTWSNLMKAPITGGKKNVGVGRGFGDAWNKYAWSMKELGGAMLVGTKNSFYDVQQYLAPSGAVKNCVDNDLYRVTGIHEPLACMELFASPAAVSAGVSATVAADTRFAEIWRYDYTIKSWFKVLDDPQSQGFRIMEHHKGKVYVGSDLGAFITGVALDSGQPGAWNFPGSRLLSSTDGKTFNEIGSCTSLGPCTSGNGLDNPYGLIGTNPNYTAGVNTSIRAMASYDGKLFVGTFNATGGQLWAYDDTANTWSFIPIQGVTGNPYKPAIMELRVYKDKLYIGLGGPSGNTYLYSYDSASGVAAPIAAQPSLPQSNVGVIKLYAGSDGLLYIGNTDLSLGFSLMTYDGTNFKTITLNGFGDTNNAYAWSMAEFNGRLYLGTFNQNFSTLPLSASAQLWYSDNRIDWLKANLPKDFGPTNYGLRTLEVAGGQLFLGTASNMLAPDSLPGLEPYKPGAEVWTLR